MKLLATITLAVCLLCGTASAQQVEEGPLVGVLMASGWIEDDFSGKTWGGGLKLGLQTKIDSDRGLWFRSVYTRVPFGPSKNVEALSTSILSEWYAGKNFSVYVDLGLENYVEGDLTGTDGFAGFGLSKILWTGKGEDWIFPPIARLFGELVLTDADAQITGNFVQVNIGLTFSKPVKE